MDKNINDFISSCKQCQMRKSGPKISQALLSPLPQCTEPNQRIHVDLFGPLRVSGNGKKYILCITDAFTKYVELVAIPDKEAKTVTSAILNRWICRFGLPLEILSDMGGEFKNKLSESLWTMLGTSHSTTSPRHPQCNAQCEIANKTIAKYLASYVNQDTLDWEVYLAPLMLYYNTSFHRSIKTSPFFLTFGIEPRLPNFPEPDLRRKFYGESDADEMKLRLLRARQIAYENNQLVTEKSKAYFDSKAKPVDYKVDQYVLLDEHSFLGKNTKLAPKFSGPHRILRLKGNTNVELLLKNGKKVIVHYNRLKPYTFPFYEVDSDILNKSTQNQKQPVNTDLMEQKTDHTSNEDVETRLPDLALFRSQKSTQIRDGSDAPHPPVTVKPPRKTRVVQQKTRPPPAPKPPSVRRRATVTPSVEQGGVASRTRSKAHLQINEGGGVVGGQGDIILDNTGKIQFADVTDEFEPDVNLIKTFISANKLANRSRRKPHVISKKLKRVKSARPTPQLRLARQLERYINPKQTKRKIVYSEGAGAPLVIIDTSSDSDSSSSFDDPPEDPVDTDYHTLGESDGSSPSTLESDPGSGPESDSGSETETEDQPRGAAGPPPTPQTGARPKSPQKKGVIFKPSKLDKLVQKADQFLYKGYPKRNIPRPNYKE